MPNPFQKLFQCNSRPKLNWGYLSLLLTALTLGGLLLALYLPLPAPRMPLATEIYDCDQNLLTTFYTQNRRTVSLGEIPPFLLQAFLSVEDHRFYQHHGINPGRILKAAWYNLSHQRLDQGGSTITQQLAKNAYLDQKRTWSRKIKELFYTVKLELQLSKEQIPELYLNQIYFGHGAYGLKVAAETYFNKDLSQLNQTEMSLLAGLPKGPSLYSPYFNSQAAHSRIEEVLQRMVDCNYISASEFKRYNLQRLNLPGLQPKPRPAPYFLDLLQAEVERLFPKYPGLIYRGGLKIESTLDSTMQKIAESALKNGIPQLYTDRQGLRQPQGALITVDPTNGEIKALIGGTDIAKSQFNRAFQAKRQPGSAFKPILYATALSHGYTLASKIDRTPQTYYLGAQIYRPLDNQNELSSGMLSLRDALAASSNVVSVKLLNQVGVQPLLAEAKKLGIVSALPPQLSLALGSGEVTPLELTTAYIPLANGGLKFKPTTIHRIFDRGGRIIYQAPSEPERVLNPGIAYLVTQALTGVFQAGGTAANWGGQLDRPAAGKTGTTEDNRDAWFIGYTPDLLTCVFIGSDHNEHPLPGSANQVAVPIWVDFTTQALAEKPALDFIIPNNVCKVSICSETGAKATVFCPKQEEFFLTGTEPTAYCPIHRFVNLEVCRRTELLPGPYCKHREIRQFAMGKQPTTICGSCRKKVYLFDWLKQLLHHSQ